MAVREKERSGSRAKDGTKKSALDLVEVLDNVLAFLSNKDLSRAIRVNSFWSNMATRHLYGQFELVNSENGRSSALAIANDAKKQIFLSLRVTGITIHNSSSVLVSLLDCIAPNLNSLTLSSSSIVTLTDLEIIAKRLPRLQSLALLFQWPNVSFSRNQTALARREAHRQTGKTDICLHGLSQATSFVHLTSLRLIGSLDLSHAGLERYLVAKGAQLRRLHIADCTNLGSSWVDLIGEHVKNLRELYLGQLNWRNSPNEAADLFNSIASCSKLWRLDLIDVHSFVLNDSPTTVTHLSLTNIPDFAPSGFKIFPHLQTLKINGCRHIFAIPARDLPKLRNLSILGGAASRMSLGNLHDLCVSGSHSIDGVLGLRKLTLDACRHPREHEVDFHECQFPESVPAHLHCYLDDAILDFELPSDAVYEILASSKTLESVALFGGSLLRGRRLNQEQVASLINGNSSLVAVHV